MKPDSFTDADPVQVRWQTEHPSIAPRERELLEPLRDLSGASLLEIGCGQGANLFHLKHANAVGVDRSFARLGEARRRVPGASFIQGDASALPFADGAFPLVLLRDVLHHVDDPDCILLEAARVLSREGRLYLLEPNGANPVMWLWATVAGFDRGIRANRIEGLERSVARAGLVVESVALFHPLPLTRVFLHYRFGWPSCPLPVLRFIEGMESLLGALVPRRKYSYIGILARLRHLPEGTAGAQRDVDDPE